jgi:predicted permease
MIDLAKDLRHALRSLAKKPGITALAAVSLALGIGVNSSIFSIVNAVLLRDLPLVAPEEVVEVYTSDSGGYPYSTSSYPDYRDLAEQAGDTFAELAAHNLTVVTWDDDDDTKLLFGEEVSGNFFDFLGLPPALGRTFQDEEDAAPVPVVILGHDFWRQRFGGDPAVLGKTLDLTGISFTIVGVGPAEYKGAFPGLVADYWVPMAMQDRMSESPSLEKRGSRSLFVKGRLRPGVGLEEAQARLDVISERFAAAFPESNEGRKFNLVASDDVVLHPFLDGPLFGVAGVLMALVGLVLLIACSNIANLLLARAADRRREIAVRLALGSSRGRLMRQLLAESLALAAFGGLLGLLFAYWTSRLIVSFQPPLPIPLSVDVGLDVRVLAFTLGLTLLTGLVCGLAPALQASRADLVSAIKDDAAGLGRRHRRFGLRNVLVVSQVAVSTVLLVGAGLFVRSLASAQAIDPGFSLRRGAAVTMAIGFGSRWTEEEGRVFFDQLLERVRALPGVTSAAYAEHLPLGLSVSTRHTQFEGQEELPEDEWPAVDFTLVGPGYFEVLGVDLLQGRDFTTADGPEAPPVAILNDTAARRYFPGESPIGKRVRFGDDDPWMEVVGVARTGKYRTLGEDPRPFVYVSHLQDYSSFMTLVAAAADESAALGQIRGEIDRLASGVPIFDQKPMSEHLDVMLFPARLGATLLLAFGVLGLVLAAVGLYGVVAYAVSKRTREVGVRMAVGAGRGDVIRLVVREGMTLVAVGLAAGLAAALFGSRALKSLLYGVTATDPWTFAGVAALLAAVALAANLVPARRATRIDPVAALRCE